jgi:osmotically-inducible protein OsmY
MSRNPSFRLVLPLLTLLCGAPSGTLPAAEPAPPVKPATPPATLATPPATTSAPAATPPAAEPNRNIGGPGDYGLREKLLHRLSGDPELSKVGVNVILVNGGVVFSGGIPTWTLKRRLMTVAATMRGIINVTDQMQILRGQVTDEQIVKAVSSLLKDLGDALDPRLLLVESEDGVVTLSGTSRDFGMRVRAEETAGTVLGVTSIVNRLRPLTTPTGTDDASIRHAVATYLKDFREYPYPCDLEVAVKEGRVTLSGRVGMCIARQQAGTMAALVGGATKVDNRIKVDPGTPLQIATVKELP